MKYDLVIFDLDGTILDTLEDLYDSANAALELFSMPHRTLAEVRSFIGNGIRRLIELSVPAGAPAEDIDGVQQAFSAHYKQHCNVKTHPYDGITGLIDRLRGLGCRTAVVSNKDDYAVRALCELHFPGLFDLAIGSRDGIRKKPAPDSVNEALLKLGCRRERTIYVGDSEVDIETARHAGLDLIIVTWGFRDEDFLRASGGTKIVRTPTELENMLIY